MKTWFAFALAALFLGPRDGRTQEDDIEWRHRAARGAIVLTANPLRPAARAAFYEARGFSARQVRPYSEACGFSFGFGNGGTTPVVVKLADWRAIGADGMSIAFKPPEHWDAEWERARVPSAARIAFRWAQFQSEIAFEPGDWIMGMATLERAPVAPFRLVARYRDTRGNHEIVLDQIDCARD